jgi:multiple antibiotic resistance protein
MIAQSKACGIATAVLVAATVSGKFILTQLGVSLPALQTSCGIILHLIALDMVFAAQSLLRTRHKDDIVVFPLAIPLLAESGAISAAIILAARAQEELAGMAIVLGALLAVIGVAALFMLMAQEIHRAMGRYRPERRSAPFRHTARCHGH